MIDSNFLDDLANKLSKLIPAGVKDVQQDVERNIKSVLQSTFSKLDLVTREEFDAQVKVLARTREKLNAIEKRLAEFEETAPKSKKEKKA